MDHSEASLKRFWEGLPCCERGLVKALHDLSLLGQSTVSINFVWAWFSPLFEEPTPRARAFLGNWSIVIFDTAPPCPSAEFDCISNGSGLLGFLFPLLLIGEIDVNDPYGEMLNFPPYPNEIEYPDGCDCEALS